MIDKPKPNNDMRIVGTNLAVLVGYTILCAFLKNEEGLFLDAFLIVLHVIFCLGSAIIMRRWAWLLGAGAVLAIGFSTCLGIASIAH
jgi:hypothetical protein